MTPLDAITLLAHAVRFKRKLGGCAAFEIEAHDSKGVRGAFYNLRGSVMMHFELEAVVSDETYTAAYRQRHRAAGLCDFCPRVAVKNRRRCRRCLDLQAARTALWEARRRKRRQPQEPWARVIEMDCQVPPEVYG